MGYKSKYSGKEVENRLDLFYFLPQQVLDALNANDWEGEVSVDYEILAPLIDKKYSILVDSLEFPYFYLKAGINEAQDTSNTILWTEIKYSSFPVPNLEGDIYSQFYTFYLDHVNKTATAKWEERFFKLNEDA